MEQRLHYFIFGAVVEHPMLTHHLQVLETLTFYPTPRNLVLVIGGTGVGKTKLLKRLHQRVRAALNEAQRNAGHVGAVYEELRSPSKGTFDFSTVHRAILRDMGTQLVDKTRPLVLRDAGGTQLQTLLVERDCSRLSDRAIEDRCFSEIDRRKPRAIILDEARSIFKIARPKNGGDRDDRLKIQSDHCKDLANRANASVMLGGAYDFFDLSVLSGQNARRSTIVHLRPYAADGDGLAGFATGVLGLLSHLPIEHDLDPAVVAVELFLQGLGCIGLAAGILSDALREALVRRVKLTINLVRKMYYSDASLRTMRAELNEGIARVDALMALEDLADRSSSPSPPPPPDDGKSKSARVLKPGECAPSNMAGCNGLW